MQPAGGGVNRPDAWFDRQLSHARRAMAEVERQHTPEEVAAAEDALAATPREPQQGLLLEVAHGR